MWTFPIRMAGGNFGRMARVDGLMAEWVQTTLNTPLSGIAARHWVAFFKLFSEGKTDRAIDAGIGAIADRIRRAQGDPADESVVEEQLRNHLSAIIDLLM